MESCCGKVQHEDGLVENLFAMYFCDVGSGCVGTNAWCSMVTCCIEIQGRWWVRWNFHKFSHRRCSCVSGCWFRMGRHECVVNIGNGCGKVQYEDGVSRCMVVVLVHDGLKPMRGLAWWCVASKFKNGDGWDENLRVWGFVVYVWGVGWGWVGTSAWCKMENLSGKVKYGNVWDENLRFEVSWGHLVMSVQDGLAPMRGVAWWTVALKLKNGDGWDEIFASQVLLCIKTLVQDAPSQMRSATWRAVAAKFNTGMCEMKILGFEALCCMLGALVHDNFFILSWQAEHCWFYPFFYFLTFFCLLLNIPQGHCV